MARKPFIEATSIQDFLDSKKGRQAIYFLNEYLILNAEIRRRRLQGLRINYENVAKEQVPNKWLKLLVKSLRRRKEVPKNWKGLKVIARRLFAVEIVSQTLMSIEDLGAFCLAFGELLEETPSRIIRYENPDIANFYRTDWTPQYISDLFLFDDPHIVTPAIAMNLDPHLQGVGASLDQQIVGKLKRIHHFGLRKGRRRAERTETGSIELPKSGSAGKKEQVRGHFNIG